jgi:hypothetical protein
MPANCRIFTRHDYEHVPGYVTQSGRPMEFMGHPRPAFRVEPEQEEDA